MKIKPIIVILVFSLIIVGIPFASNSNFTSRQPITSLKASHIASDETHSLTWTSRWESIPQPVVNDSAVIGDHVILNSTFDETLLGKNITRTELKIIDGFTFSTTRSLKPISGSTLEFPYDDIDWIYVSGMESGDLVNITAYAENDCDYFAFSGDMAISDYDVSTDLLSLQMDTMNNPEHGVFVWSSTSDTMVFGCYNYDNTTEGNWSVYMEIGEMSIHNAIGSSLSLDTYWLDNVNDTYEITAIAYTESNESFVHQYENITICNFFAPSLLSISIQNVVDITFNITWLCSDLNVDDENFYSLWLSNNDGLSYLLLAMNLTQPWYLWNSTGWLQGDYVARVRAYSVDLSPSSPCSLDNPPNNYWPGDMSEIISPPFEAGGVHTFVPPFISVGHVDNIAYALGSVSNNITFQITLTPYYRMMIRYYIQDNGTDWVSGYFYSTNSTSEVTMFFDGLPLGSHNILVTFITDWDSTSTEFTILVYQTNTTSTTTSTTTTYSTQNTTDFSYLFHSILIGISIGSSLVIVTVVILTINLRHKHSRQITSCSDFLQVSLSLS